MMRYDFAIVGGGIIGLSSAMAIAKRNPQGRVLVLEKEPRVGAHQTGHNSGVIHSGIYYKPGSFKAKFARAGSESMVAFCKEQGIRHEICGKVIVATEPDEVPLLDRLHRRGLENGLEIRKIGSGELKELEPHVAGITALHVPSAGIVDYRLVAERYAEILRERNGEIRLSTTVERIFDRPNGIVLETSAGTVEADVLVNCSGLHSDRVARLAGQRTPARIVPFRGEYYELRPEKRSLVKNLIYPVPNPNFPFLGVHFTRMIDGTVHAGPNAVLSLMREGYEKTNFSVRDTVDIVTHPGFWRLASRHAGDGMKELWRSMSKSAFVRSLQRLIPEITADDVIPTHAGVRAQALNRDGSLVDDFLILGGKRSVHVCNAPSPAATASLEIGEAVADRVASLQTLEPV